MADSGTKRDKMEPRQRHLHFAYAPNYFCISQHLQDMLELDLSALDFMMKCFPEIKEVEDMRKSIGRYGLTGKQQVGMKVDKFKGTKH